MSLAGITYVFIEGPAQGWTAPAVLGLAALAAVSALGFVLVESAVRSPMLPFEIFNNRQFSATNGVTFAVYAALGGALFLVPIELQLVGRSSPSNRGSHSYRSR